MQNIYKKIISNKPVIIAEAGVNHNGRISIGKKLIDAAKRAGADCIKFQTYKASDLTIKKAKRFWDWSGEKIKIGTQYDSYSKLDSFNFDEYKKLFDYCNKIKIEFQSTPFDIKSLQILQRLGVGTYKIASCDITNFLLINEVAKTKKPIFLSTGASTIKEIGQAVKIIKKYHNKVVIMHCTLCYPTLLRDANLLSILKIKESFPSIPVGFSDHTLGTEASILSFALGSMALEKHFTINKKLKISADHWLSVNEMELKEIVDKSKNILKIFGKKEKKPLICEMLAKKNARRSLVANKDITKGEIFTYNNLTAKRPGLGVSANKFYNYINKKSKRFYKEDDLIKKQT